MKICVQKVEIDISFRKLQTFCKDGFSNNYIKSFVIFLFVHFLIYGEIMAQSKTLIDTTKPGIKFYTKDIRNLKYECKHCCLENPEASNRHYLKDEQLNSLLTYLDNTIYSKVINKSDIINVLTKAKLNNKSSCLLPFLKLIDSNAEFVSKYCCIETTRTVRHLVYCDERSIKFLILFYAQFVYSKHFKLPNGKAFLNIYIEKQNVTEEYELTDNDYNEIIDIYISKINKYKNISNRNVLKNSNYKWVVKSEKFSPDTAWMRSRNIWPR